MKLIKTVRRWRQTDTLSAMKSVISCSTGPHSRHSYRLELSQLVMMKVMMKVTVNSISDCQCYHEYLWLHTFLLWSSAVGICVEYSLAEKARFSLKEKGKETNLQNLTKCQHFLMKTMKLTLANVQAIMTVKEWCSCWNKQWFTWKRHHLNGSIWYVAQNLWISIKD